MARKKKRAAVRVEPVAFEVYRGRKLLGWVDTNMYRYGRRGEWHSTEGGRGRCVSRKAGVAALLASFREPLLAPLPAQPEAHKAKEPRT